MSIRGAVRGAGLLLVAALAFVLLSSDRGSKNPHRPPLERPAELEAGPATAPLLEPAPGAAEAPAIAPDPNLPMPAVEGTDSAFSAHRGRLVELAGALHYNGPNYGVTFAREGVTFAPPERLDDDHPRLILALDSLRCGEHELVREASAHPQAESGGGAVAYARGGVAERYLLQDKGIEQTFVLDTLPSERGEIVARVRTRTNLTGPAPGTEGARLIYSEGEHAWFTIAHALVFDAAGKTLDLPLRAESDGYTMTIPAEWVESAVAPVTIDPIIGTSFIVDFPDVPTPPTAIARPWLDVAYSTTSNLWIVVWTERIGGGQYDIFYRRVSSTGTFLDASPVTIDSALGSSEHPSVAWLSSGNTFLAVWQYDPDASGGGSDIIIEGRRILAGGGFAAVKFTVSPAAAVSQRRPDVAGDNAPTGLAPYWMVTWQRDTTATNGDILQRTVTSSQTLGASAISVDTDPDHSINPAISWNSPLGRFLTVWLKNASASSESGLPSGRIWIASSSTLGALTSAYATTSGHRFIDVAGGGSEWLVVYETIVTASQNDIRGWIAGSSGAPVAGAAVGIATSTLDQKRPRVMYDTLTSEWFVVYEEMSGGASGRDIVGRRVLTGAPPTIFPTGSTTAGYAVGGANSDDEFMPVVPQRQNTSNVMLVGWHRGSSAGSDELRAIRFSLDYAGPPAPPAPDLVSTSDTGSSTTDNVTSDTTPDLLVGPTLPGGLVSLYTSPSTLRGTGTADASGFVTITSSAATPDAVYSFYATVTDPVTLTPSGPSPTLSVTIDTAPPSAPSTPDLAAASDLGTSSTDNITSDSTPTFSGSATTGTLVSLYTTGGVLRGTATAAGGAYSVTASPSISDGSYGFYATATDLAGNASGPSGTLTPVIIDTVAPSPAPSAAPDLTAASDTGASFSDNITSDTTPTFTGTAGTAADTINLYAGATLVGSGPGGSYTITSSTLVASTYSFTVRISDVAGNVSGPSPGLSVTIDTAISPAPSTPDLASGSDSGSSSTDNITTDATPTFTGIVETGATVTLFVGATPYGSVVAAAGSYSIIASPALVDGTYLFYVTASDVAGNSATSGTLSVTIDSIAPAAPSTPDLAAASDLGSSPTDNITSDSTPTFTGTAETGATVSLYTTGGTLRGTVVAAAGAYSVTASPAIADESYGFYATATDPAGNVSGVSGTLTPVVIDTVPPTTPGTAPTLDPLSDTGTLGDGITTDTTPEFTGTAGSAGDTITLLASGTPVGTGPATAYSITSSPLATGTSYSFTVTATDVAGNVSGPSPPTTVFIDTGVDPPPTTPDLDSASDTGASSIDNITSVTTPTFTGTVEAGSTVTLFVGATSYGSVVAAAGTYSITADPALADGTYLFYVTAVDLAANTATSGTLSVTIDTTPPAAPSIPDLAAASDLGSSSTDNVTSESTPTFTGTAEAGATVTLFVGATSYGSATAAGGSWSIPASTVSPDGPYAFYAVTTDLAGNVGPASGTLTVTIDTSVPAAPGSAPTLDPASDTGTPGDGVTTDTTPTFTGTAGAAGETITLLANGAPVGSVIAGPGGSYSITASALGVGTYAFEVTITDLAGNTSAVSPSVSVTIDAGVSPPPSTPDLDPASDTGLSSTDNVTSDTTPTFTGTVEPGASLSLLAGATVVETGTATAGGTYSLTPPTPLATGSYSFSVSATDGAGNTATSGSLTVAIDGTPPPTPTALSQFYSDGTTPLPAGGASAATTVVLQATITDVPSSGLVRLHVEVVSVGSSFSAFPPGTPTVSGSFVASGSVVQLTTPALPLGDYVWRCWSEDALGQLSTVTEFPPGATDFSIVPNTAPPAPAALGQFRVNGATAILVGGSTVETAVVLRATVTDPDGNSVRAEFEVKDISAPLDGTGTPYAGNLVSSGGESSATVPIAIGSYHWRVRARDYSGDVGPWVAFGGNSDTPPADTDVARTASASNSDPDAPSSLGQFATNGVTPIALGGTTSEAFVLLKANVSDSDGNPCALEVEVKTTTLGFDGTGTSTGAFVLSGGTASVTFPSPAGSYHWRARTVDSVGGLSGWVAFGGNSDVPTADADFVSAPTANTPPDPPPSGSLAQLRLDGITSIPQGGSTNEVGVLLRATVSDPDAGNGVAIEVEVKPIASAFLSVPSATGSFVASGSTAEARILGLTPGVSYHWQARAVDFTGDPSAWVSFGTNLDLPPPAGTDFATTGANTAPSVASPQQFRSNGVTVIASGGSVNEQTVVFQGVVSDLESTGVRFEVEVVPDVPGIFTGDATARSAFLPSGTIIQVVVSGLAVGTSYRWRYRAVDTGGLASAWTDFLASNPDFVCVPNLPPTAPTVLEQRRQDGLTVIPLGGGTSQAQFRIFAFVSDPDGGDMIRLQAEVKPELTSFDGSGLVSGTFVSNGNLADVTASIPAAGWYHWRVRAIDSQGSPGSWEYFSLMTDQQVERLPNTTPSILSIGQYYAGSLTAASIGAIVLREARMLAAVTDLELDAAWLEVEIRRVGTGFSNTATHTSPLLTPPGNLIIDAALAKEDDYHWQYRVLDDAGNSTPWTSFGGNPETEKDFRFDFGGNSGQKHTCGSGVSASGPHGLGLATAALLAGLLLLGLRAFRRALTPSAASGAPFRLGSGCNPDFRHNPLKTRWL